MERRGLRQGTQRGGGRGSDQFGISVALSADGATLAVGALNEGSAASGAFHPRDGGYAAALADSNAAAAAYAYGRPSTGQWSVEAYVEAPNARASAQFGASIALSADGGTLAAGADSENRQRSLSAPQAWDATTVGMESENDVEAVYRY